MPLWMPIGLFGCGARYPTFLNTPYIGLGHSYKHSARPCTTWYIQGTIESALLHIPLLLQAPWLLSSWATFSPLQASLSESTSTKLLSCINNSLITVDPILTKMTPGMIWLATWDSSLKYYRMFSNSRSTGMHLGSSVKDEYLQPNEL